MTKTMTLTLTIAPEMTPSARVTPMTPTWGEAKTKAERKRRNARLHRAFAGTYTREEWLTAQALVLAGTHGYRKAIAVARA